MERLELKERFTVCKDLIPDRLSDALGNISTKTEEVVGEGITDACEVVDEVVRNALIRSHGLRSSPIVARRRK